MHSVHTLITTLRFGVKNAGRRTHLACSLRRFQDYV
jgi:hypothetical protein